MRYATLKHSKQGPQHSAHGSNLATLSIAS
jgi:hypothetical protein